MYVAVSLFFLENSGVAMLLYVLILVCASVTGRLAVTASPKIPASVSTLGPGRWIRDGENWSIVSVNGEYELGFFSPGDSKNRYLGIWYKNVVPSVYVWVANRETPLSDRYGLLHFTPKGVLQLLNGSNNTIWSSNLSASGLDLVLLLMDSGNLVVKEDGDNSSIFWQSFDHPGDTLLPGMKIGRNFRTGVDRFLTSWTRADDPASGQFSLWIDPAGYPQLVLRNGSLKHYRLGSWNGLRFTGTPELPAPYQFLKYEFVLNKNEVFYTSEFLHPIVTMLLVNRSGFLERFVHPKDSTSWATLYFAPRDQCDYFSFCGAYMICKMDNSPICSCLEGFVLRFPNDASKGCARTIPLNSLNCTGDIFQNYTGLKLPDTSLSWYDTSMSLAKCREMCSRNCSCTAFTKANISGEGSGCLLWFGDLIDMREYSTGGQDMYIRMSTFKPVTDGTKTKLSRSKLIGITVSLVLITGMLMIGLIVLLRNRKQRKQGRRSNRGGDNEDVEIFDLDTILNATDHFSNSNKLGQGGFGPVYKGTLADGQEIAVKRLSKSSTQGIKEFENEVIMIAKLQHRNLVKLLGCCLEEEEIMLIYEFMPNKSLDFFIFDQTRSKFLDWDKRYVIIDGIARGLLYLHQDSRLRIIHRDLKASNILLDNDMNPKISDFGMARMFGGDQTEAETCKIVGTYGYMAPEYTVDGHFSVKSDVFSYGVLVLEIVSGKKNRGFSHEDHSHNLLGHAWKLWNEERALELVDRMVDDSYSVWKVLRCIHISLLCVQQRAEDRPNMTSVVVMLGSEGALPDPKQPGFFTERSVPAESGSSTSMQESSVENHFWYLLFLYIRTD